MSDDANPYASPRAPLNEPRSIKTEPSGPISEHELLSGTYGLWAMLLAVAWIPVAVWAGFQSLASTILWAVAAISAVMASHHYGAERRNAGRFWGAASIVLAVGALGLGWL